jgi:transposase-like protein
MTALPAPQFTNETAAIAHLEASRWPDGVNCPHCGSVNVHRMGGETQAGMFLCNDCRDKFTARTGTVMERSHIPVHKWLLAIHLMSSNKNGVSAHELHRNLGITYKSAWFLAHRIREAMDIRNAGAMGGGSADSVQIDETYYGNTSKRAKNRKRGHKHKASIVALVEPKTGRAAAFHVKSANATTVQKLARTYVRRESVLVTDESSIYKVLGREFSDHQTVNHHHAEYVNKAGYTTNHVENFFLQFKRGMRGTFIHCDEQHVQRYLNEFAFRYSNRSGVGIEDAQRAALALKGIEGKRLTYRRPN